MNDAVTWLDLVVFILLAFFVVRGAWVGLIRQLAAFFALVGSYVIAARYVGLLLPWTRNFVDRPALVFLVSFVLLFLAAAILFSLAGKILHRLVQVVLLGWFDRLLGLLLGIVKAGILASLLYMALASTLSASNTLLSRSCTAPFLREGAELLKTLIQDQKIRDYFRENTPAIPPELMNPDGEKTKNPAGLGGRAPASRDGRMRQGRRMWQGRRPPENRADQPRASARSASRQRPTKHRRSSCQSCMTLQPAAFSRLFSRMELAGRLVGVGYSAVVQGSML